ncbi:hypothetical protein M513_05927 [Trichuris suis]|uniref:Uncharacterized protein n=1 Tax=Trichuris suis TaxID=68888 RepID=A0A085M7M1_9BILA|nr:hypothetical protein M513_05927 [Trichuris suis]
MRQLLRDFAELPPYSAVILVPVVGECAVLLVDSGERAYVTTEDMRGHLRGFATLPPLVVMQCPLLLRHRPECENIGRDAVTDCVRWSHTSVSSCGSVEECIR